MPTPTECAQLVKHRVDATYRETLRVLNRWIGEHGDDGRAHPGLRRLSAERGLNVNTMCSHLATLRACGVVRRVGRRGYWDKAAGHWVRLADSYQVTNAGKEWLRRGAPQQSDALDRLLKAAPRRRGCPRVTWLENLAQRQAAARLSALEADSLAPSIRRILASEPGTLEHLSDSSTAAGVPTGRTRYVPPPELFQRPDPAQLAADIAAARAAAGLVRPPT